MVQFWYIIIVYCTNPLVFERSCTQIPSDTRGGVNGISGHHIRQYLEYYHVCRSQLGYLLLICAWRASKKAAPGIYNFLQVCECFFRPEVTKTVYLFQDRPEQKKQNEEKM